MSRRRTDPAPLYAVIEKELETLADPERAAQQRAYMKSAMPYAGVAATPLHKACRAAFKAWPPAGRDDWLDAIADLWRRARVREMRYAAIELLNYPRFSRAWLAPDMLPLVREMIVSGAWWDYVDSLAANTIGTLLVRFPDALTPELYRWAEDENLWIRRTAILAQLKRGENMDVS